MNNNQTIQEIKPDHKGKAIASLILGIISSLIGLGSAINLFTGTVFIEEFLHTYDYNLSSFLTVSFLISGIGILFGKKGLKSTKKGLAIMGMVLSIIGLLGSLFFYFIIKGMMAGF